MVYNKEYVAKKMFFMTIGGEWELEGLLRVRAAHNFLVESVNYLHLDLSFVFYDLSL